MTNWQNFTGNQEPTSDWELPASPSWRPFGEKNQPGESRRKSRGETFQIVDENQIKMVNAALYLRRPLLITGKPGTGKSSIAYKVAYELNLGEVLYWPITTRTTLKDGLYNYDAIGRLQEVKLSEQNPQPLSKQQQKASLKQIEKYITLGPLGTALLPSKKPRILLIDEIDKSDIDLPNDLLTLFEEGYFKIPELVRLKEEVKEVTVGTAYNDETEELTAKDRTATIEEGIVSCKAFPFVILTSNGERDFPAPFLRRCLRLTVKSPNQDELVKVIEKHIDTDICLRDDVIKLIKDFIKKRNKGTLATDQLLNALFLIKEGKIATDDDIIRLINQDLGTVESSDD